MLKIRYSNQFKKDYKLIKKRGYLIKLKEIIYNKPLILFILFILYCYLSLLWTDNLTFGISHLNFYTSSVHYTLKKVLLREAVE